MSQKQGGKGKQSSQSDKNYWARVSARPGKISKTKELRAARHAKRMGITLAQLQASGACQSSPVFPRVAQKRPVERTVFSGSGIPKHPPENPAILICEGVTIDIGPTARTLNPRAALSPGLAFSHGIVNSITGNFSPLDFRGPGAIGRGAKG